jgi:uncharacterized protein (TIGR03089 family)
MELARFPRYSTLVRQGTERVIAAADRPVLTVCDDATGERTELTGAELGSWAARTAGLLRDGCRLTAGDQVAVMAPAHWQTAAVLLGAWSIGLTVSVRPWATAGLASAVPESPFDALFVARHRLDSWLEAVPAARHRFVLGLLPHGAALESVPDRYRDYVVAVRQHPDPPPAYQRILPTDPASPDGTTFQEWAEVARELASRLGLTAGDRLLVDVAAEEQPVTWLLAPLSVGATVVLCANLDRATIHERAAAEGATHVL